MQPDQRRTLQYRRARRIGAMVGQLTTFGILFWLGMTRRFGSAEAIIVGVVGAGIAGAFAGALAFRVTK